MRNVVRSTAFRVGVAMLLVLLVGVLVLVDRGTKGHEDQPVRFGVLADHPIGTLPAKREVCQSPVDLDRAIRTVGLGVDSAAKGGPPLRVTIRDSANGNVLRSARVGGGYKIPLKGFLTVPLDGAVPSDRAVSVCAQNLGRRSLTLVGKEAVLDSEARVGSQILDGDWGVFFPNPDAKPRNYLQMAPDMLDRAAVLRPGIVTPLLYVLLALVAFVAGPVLLWRAVVSAANDDEDDGEATPDA